MPAKCRLLILTPQLPFPPDQGAPIRNWNFIRYLGSSNRYEVTLLSFARPGEHGTTQEATAIETLKKYCSRVEIVAAPPRRSKLARLRTLLKVGRPDLAMRLASPVFQANLKCLLETQRFDAVLCEGLELAPFVLTTFANASPRPRLILDEHNAEWLLQHRAYQNDRAGGYKRLPAAIYSYLQAYRLRLFEQEALKFFDCAIAVSEQDKAALAKIGAAEAKIKVIPNGMDVTEFAPRPEVTEKKDSLVFSGTMDFRPNIDAVTWFINEVWPLIVSQKPNAKFTIVGKRPTTALQALVDKNPGVILTGSVADTRPYIWDSAVYVVPMRIGGGVRFKVLEALAMEKAVVTTAMGADGIPLTPSLDAEVASEPRQFADAVVNLLNNSERRQALGKHGRTFVTAHFDWNNITPILDSLLLE